MKSEVRRRKSEVRRVATPNADAPAADGLTPTLNAVAMPDAEAPEWLSIPYGTVPYHVGQVNGLQRLNLGVAELLCAVMTRAMKLDPRNSGGFPFYCGHPDFFNASDADAVRRWMQAQPPAVGWIKEFRAGASALEIRVEWTADGAQMVNGKTYRFFSPFFRSEPVERENGLQIYEPRIMQSAGLTNTPNWPMPPMVNAAILDGGDNKESGMNLLQRLIALLGDATIATEDDLVNAVQKMISGLKALRDSIDARWKAEDAARQALPNAGDPFALAEGLIANMDGLLAAANARATELEASQTDLVATLNAKVVAERTAHAETLVHAAVSRGAVLQEHAASRIADMVNAGDAFADKARELASLPALMKTEPRTQGVEARSTEIADRRERFHEFVNAALSAHGNDYDAAFAAVAKEHPELLSGGAGQ